jgi:GAF domain-containing protein
MPLGEAEFRQLIPLLHPRTRIHDMDVLKAWYEAVADALRAELPADLLAIWIFDAEGEPILLEPEALLEDNLEVPSATPIANQHLLDALEVRIRRAGYGSVLLHPIRHGGQDVGLMLLTCFAPHAYGIRAGGLLDAAADVLGPMLARVARASTGPDEPHPEHLAASLQEPEGPVTDRVRDRAREGTLFETLSDAIGGAGTPRDLMLALSFALQSVLPHDGYEVLLPDSGGESCYRIGLHGHGGLWGDPNLIVAKAALDPEAMFGERESILIADTSASGNPQVPELITMRGPEEPPRSLVGVKLRVVERLVGYLLLGSGGPGFYREEDIVLLDRVGALLAPRIENLVLAWQYSVLRGQLDLLRHVPMHLAQAAELLASTPFLGEGSQVFMQQVVALLPVSALEFAVRIADDQRVAVVKPGVPTPLADLPQEPIEGTGVAQVVRGEVPFLLSTEDLDSGGKVAVLVVPLRTEGRIIGAMAMTALGPSPFSRNDLALAQQLADLVAPHLDLARRAASPATPFIPGWKRPTLRPDRESMNP